MNISKNLLPILIATGLLGCQSTTEPEGKVVTYAYLCESKAIDIETAVNRKIILRTAPEYPINAARNGVSGYAKMVFDISRNGTPTNIQVVESYPDKTFEKASVSTLSKWRFSMAETDTKCLTVQLDFKLG